MFIPKKNTKNGPPTLLTPHAPPPPRPGNFRGRFSGSAAREGRRGAGGPVPGAAGQRLGGRQGDAAHRRGRRPSGRGTGDGRVEARERGEDKLPGAGGGASEFCGENLGVVGFLAVCLDSIWSLSRFE